MPQRDSVDKIVESYFGVVTDEDFEYKGKQYKRRPLVVSTGLLRGFTCPPMCGGCCPRFSLDYLPSEDIPEAERTPMEMVLNFGPRPIEFNGKTFRISSYTQEDHESHHCRNLNMETGRCGIHGRQPFSCDFELIRSAKFLDEDRPHRLTTRLFGRGWQLKRIDDDRGALCTITPIDDETIRDTIRKLKRLKQWCEHFNLKHRVDHIIAWAMDPVARTQDLTLN